MNSQFIRVRTIVMSLTVCIQIASESTEAITVHFDQPVYVVSGPGDLIPAQIIIDANEDTPADDLVPDGLFSFGTRVSFNATKARVNDLADIETEPELSFFGFDAGPFVELAAGTAATKGNIDQNADPLVPYEGTNLAVVTIENLANALDEYPLELDFFNTLGPDENIFVDGDGVTLDDSITFIPSRVRVVPEPGAVALALCLAVFIPLRTGRQVEFENIAA